MLTHDSLSNDCLDKLSVQRDKSLSGWGRYPVINCHVWEPEQVSSLAEVMPNSNDIAVLPRGGGRSYGDAALLPNGLTLLSKRLNGVLAFNQETGLLRCESGLSFTEILDAFVPLGWFLPVTPGTKFVTVGGAVAFDVHGKNHHQDGSFSRYVSSLQLMLASGEIVQCSPQDNSDLFWATVGGMGLTGFITEVEFFLHPIQTAYISSHKIKAKNLDDAFALFEQYEPQYQYSVAWIDCLASGNALGRSILMFGNHAKLDELPAKQHIDPLQIKSKSRFRVSFDLPAGLLNRYTIAAFNQLYYAKLRSPQVKSIVDYDSFFYPLDFLWDWNRLYGKRGFVQYQCVLPPEVSRESLIEILQLCYREGWGSFLAVLKRFGPQEGLLSFPMPGYTLTLDMPVKQGLWDFLNRLDLLVIQYGGRVYLAKDARLSADLFRVMYPNYPQWLEIKSKVDPKNRFSSALSQRLKIEPIG